MYCLDVQYGNILAEISSNLIMELAVSWEAVLPSLVGHLQYSILREYLTQFSQQDIKRSLIRTKGLIYQLDTK